MGAGIRAVAVAVIALTGLLSAAGAVAAQVDLAKTLVGTWEGEVKARMLRGPDAGAELKLIITSVTQQDGKWIADGRLGGKDGRSAPVKVDIDTSGSKPSLRFKGASGTDYALSLFNDKQMAGTATLTTAQAKSSTGARDRDVILEKKN
jgi:hypothetical protein